METPQDLAEAGGEDEEPDERANEGGEKALALMQKAQNLAPNDAPETGEIAHRPETAGRFRYFRCAAAAWAEERIYIDVHAASACVVPVMTRKASRSGRWLPVARQKARQCASEQHASLVQDDDKIGVRDSHR